MMMTAMIVKPRGREECENFPVPNSAYNLTGAPLVEGGANTVSNVQEYGDGHTQDGRLVSRNGR